MSSEEQVPWIPGVNSSYHSGVDGLSLPLLAMTAVVFLACAVYALRDAVRLRAQVALFLFLQGVSLGVFVLADLFFFFLFFVLFIVGMYFILDGLCYGTVDRSALKLVYFNLLYAMALL